MDYDDDYDGNNIHGPEEPISIPLMPCGSCGRNFNPKSLAKHQNICAKVSASSKRRGTFDSSKVRTDELEVKPKPADNPEKYEKAAAKKNNWKAKHEAFVSAIRSARQVQQILDAGGSVADLPPPPRSENPDYIQCPTCSRRFEESAGQRHMPFCAEQAKRKAIKEGGKVVKNNPPPPKTASEGGRTINRASGISAGPQGPAGANGRPPSGRSARPAAADPAAGRPGHARAGSAGSSGPPTATPSRTASTSSAKGTPAPAAAAPGGYGKAGPASKASGVSGSGGAGGAGGMGLEVNGGGAYNTPVRTGQPPAPAPGTRTLPSRKPAVAVLDSPSPFDDPIPSKLNGRPPSGRNSSSLSDPDDRSLGSAKGALPSGAYPFDRERPRPYGDAPSSRHGSASSMGSAREERVPSSLARPVGAYHYCGACGTNLDSLAAPKYCMNCGMEFSPRSKFCGECGTRR
eukprot:m.115255 g.115255  ORF g.115255 m.115255 type:complete len:460 (+) comp9167_c0_seq2:41-1420(+)